MIFSHILHLKRLSPVWTFWCCPRVCAFLKDSPHVFQEIDFCFVWTLMWYFNWSSSTKVLLQCWQENGLSPELYFYCLPREPSCLNDLLHCLHENNLFPVWTTLCIWFVLKYFFREEADKFWLLFRMNSHMMLQLSCFQKSFVSVLTRKMLFSRIMLFMPPKSACLREWFVAIFVCKWPCSCVHYIVPFQVMSCFKIFSTDDACHSHFWYYRLFIDINVTSLHCNCCTLWVDVFTCTNT